MGAFSSKKKKRAKNSVTDQDRAQLDLKNARDRLKRYQKRLDQECQKLQAQALAMIKEGRKDRALLLLKVKKLKQDQANKADAQLLSVYQMVDTIDWETQQLKVFEALKEGNKALTQLHEEMPLEKVEELMADTAENIAVEEEISKAIGGSWTDANEEDLLSELAAIEKEQEEPAVVSEVVAPTKPARVAGPAANELEELLPEAPTTAPVVEAEGTVEAEAEKEETTKAPALVPA